MRRLNALLFGLVLGGACMSFAHRYHVVQTHSEWLLVPKTNNSISATYVDIRSWNAETWRRHPELIEALYQHGRGEVVARPAAERDPWQFFPGAAPQSRQQAIRR